MEKLLNFDSLIVLLIIVIIDSYFYLSLLKKIGSLQNSLRAKDGVIKHWSGGIDMIEIKNWVSNNSDTETAQQIKKVLSYKRLVNYLSVIVLVSYILLMM